METVNLYPEAPEDRERLDAIRADVSRWVRFQLRPLSPDTNVSDRTTGMEQKPGTIHQDNQ
jgi:hypothetical protein